MEHVISYSPEFDLKWQDILKLQAARHPLGELNPTRLFYYQFMFTASVVRGGQAAPRLCKSFSGSSLRVRTLKDTPKPADAVHAASGIPTWMPKLVFAAVDCACARGTQLE